MSKYEINCALCGKNFGSLEREDGDEFGEFYHCKDCVEKFRKEHEEDEEELENYV